jgi:hypothetical protein
MRLRHFLPAEKRGEKGLDVTAALDFETFSPREKVSKGG